MPERDPTIPIEEFLAAGTEDDRQRVRRIFAATRKIVEREARAQPPARRDQHAKHVGCLWAYLDVVPGLPDELAQGIFAATTDEQGNPTSRRYRAWVRFSNSSPRPQSDAKLDGRAIAIKVLEVAGQRAASEELTRQNDTQDFVLLNNSAFFAEDLEEMTRIFEWQAEDRALPYYFVKNRRLRSLWQLLKHAARPDSPLDLTYHSQLPFALGACEVKYRLKPLSGIQRTTATAAERDSGDHLRYVLQRQLPPTVEGGLQLAEAGAGDAVFSLQVVKRRVPKDSLERGNVSWRVCDKHFVEVARLRIPRQDFHHPDRMDFAEHMSFSVWNALQVHRPLGALNWARAPAYAYVRHLRHEANRAHDPEYTRREWEWMRA